VRRRRIILGTVLLAVPLTVALWNVAGAAGPKPLWSGFANDRSISKPVIGHDLKHDVSKPLREIAPIAPGTGRQEAPENPMKHVQSAPGGKVDTAVQSPQQLSPMPALQQSFDTQINTCGCYPPDTNGDVGTTQYVQTVNLTFAVYSKTGSTLYGPAATNTIWSGFGGACQTTNDGDPVVQWDPLASRWVISQFAFPNGTGNGPYDECVAVSQTNDATGSWYRYDFNISNTLMDDYPKMGVWPDAYYFTFNDFDHGGPFTGATVTALDRNAMINGQAATTVQFVLGTAFGGMLPSDMDGSTAPPVGSPNYVVQFDDDAAGYPQDQLEVWQFHVDWTTPANSTFTSGGNIATAAFDSNQPNIPQKGGPALESLTDRLMYRLAYRNFGDHEAMVLNHTVNSNGAGLAGFRWYELRRTGGNWSIFQQSTYAPDAENRWMGSIAMDKKGNIAAGYSFANGSTYASIGYGGRLASDPANSFTMESTVLSGTGAQTGSAVRWGDYSNISVDPTDDCTFWYTSEYILTTGQVSWRTHVASFQYPSCNVAQQPPSIANFTPTSGSPGTPVTVNGSGFTGTSAVKFNGTAAGYTVNSDTKITATVPSNATSGKIAVTNSLGTATSTQTFSVTKPQPPTIASFTPTSGHKGASVTITGTNFTGATAVKLGGTTASFTVNSATKITAVVPNKFAGFYKWQVTTPVGTATSFTYFRVF
jgi:hypothetical protein